MFYSFNHSIIEKNNFALKEPGNVGNLLLIPITL